MICPPRISLMSASDSTGTFNAFNAWRPPSKVFSISAPTPTTSAPVSEASLYEMMNQVGTKSAKNIVPSLTEWANIQKYGYDTWGLWIAMPAGTTLEKFQKAWTAILADQPMLSQVEAKATAIAELFASKYSKQMGKPFKLGAVSNASAAPAAGPGTQVGRGLFQVHQ